MSQPIQEEAAIPSASATVAAASEPRHALLQTKGISRRARLFDAVGRYLIAAGGIGIIAAVLGIFVFIAKETYPLFAAPEVDLLEERDLSGDDEALAIDVDPYHEVVLVARAHSLDFLRLGDGSLIERTVPDGSTATAAGITAAYRAPGRLLALGSADGRVWTGSYEFDLRYEGDTRFVDPELELDPVATIDAGAPIAAIAYRHDGDARAAIGAITATGRVLILARETTSGLLGPGRTEEGVFELTEQLAGRPTAITVDASARSVHVGTDGGEIWEWELNGADEAPALAGSFVAAPRQPITALEFLLGNQSLVVGDAGGGLATWFRAQGADGGRGPYRRIHGFEPHAAPVVRLSPSTRDKQFLSGAADGRLALHHATSEQTFFTRSTPSSIRDLAFAPKMDAFVTLSDTGRLTRFRLHNPHPEITLQTLFGKVWYEGYGEPEHVWQSTGGTDEFEPKISLVPLVFGTAKGTFYAMLFALPLALLAAIYTSEFASAPVRNTVKPTVEIMASLPSVILGFLAGLWLAPLLDDHLVGVACCLVAIPVVALLASWGWRGLPQMVRNALPPQTELAVLVGVVCASSAAALFAGPSVEALLFGESLKSWLNSSTDLGYDQRNSVIIGFAMGFAVIPLIFTICEDALSSVPRSLRAGSLALGANRWQTAIKVVLPMAAPGVFSAAMIGFGRAIGETMIVLMATGNTPIMDWNIFNGMRTISANIAVELPEAPHEGTLYRVLFLSGLLLFAVTFAINTTAETVRQRLREKYKRV